MTVHAPGVAMSASDAAAATRVPLKVPAAALSRVRANEKSRSRGERSASDAASSASTAEKSASGGAFQGSGQ
jgi:hypothetical protein